MGYFDKTKLEAALAELRWWVERRRQEPSHYYAGIGAMLLGALGCGTFAAGAAIGKAVTVVSAAILGAALGAWYGQRQEG